MPKQKSFPVGATVAHSHRIGPVHAHGSILTKAALASQDPTAPLGVVLEPADGQAASHHRVEFTAEDGTTSERVLTSDELVEVGADEPAEEKA